MVGAGSAGGAGRAAPGRVDDGLRSLDGIVDRAGRALGNPQVVHRGGADRATADPLLGRRPRIRELETEYRARM